MGTAVSVGGFLLTPEEWDDEELRVLLLSALDDSADPFDFEDDGPTAALRPSA